MARIRLPRKLDYHTLRTWLLEYKHLSSAEIARLSGITVGKIREWMVYCDVINPKDEVFKVWIKYKNYSASEACVILGISVPAFRKALKRHGIKKYRMKSMPRKFKGELPIDLPRTKEGLEKLFQKYGTHKLAKLSGYSTVLIWRLRNKYDVVNCKRDKFLARPNECNDQEWLEEHYIKQKLSLRQCAKIAGVTPMTIRSWLISHKIVPRPRLGRNAILQAGIPQKNTAISTETAGS